MSDSGCFINKEEHPGSAYKAGTWMEKTALENADGVINR